jgi:hypothetical protein
MSSSSKWRRVALVRIDVSEERISNDFSVERIPEVGTTLAVNTRLRHSVKKHKIYDK